MDERIADGLTGDRATDVSAVETGARAEANIRRMNAALRARAASLAPFAHSSPGRSLHSSLFRSFFVGGFECSTHRRRDGRRLDLSASTGHAANAAADYRMLAGHGIRTVRDGLRWHLIETAPGRYDWSSFLPMLRAARETGTQVIWDLAHYGWPDDIDIWTPAFVDRFARFAGAAARIVREEGDEVPFYTPVNEISFWAWGGGDVGYINPCTVKRGGELKAILARAAIAAIEAVREVDPRARIVSAEPAIHIIPRSRALDDVRAARDYTLAQFEAQDMIAGRLRPDLGGRPGNVDIVGVNYYEYNQWVDGDLAVGVDHPQYRPLRQMLADVHARYGRPVFVSETGIEGALRPAWARMVTAEVAAARGAGVPVEGICLYPVLDYPGWENDRHCPTGLFGYSRPDGTRPVDGPLADELALYGAEQERPARRRRG